MTPLDRAAIVLALRDRLESSGSWCGETHLQKATFLLQVAKNVPLDYHFILYKYGPFAFDLREDIARMLADRILERQRQQAEYGPRYRAGPYADRLMSGRSDLIERYRDAIDSTADFVGSRGIYDLERLATALLLIDENAEVDDDELSEKLHEIKPHVDRASALEAVGTIRQYRAGASPAV